MSCKPAPIHVYGDEANTLGVGRIVHFVGRNGECLPGVVVGFVVEPERTATPELLVDLYVMGTRDSDVSRFLNGVLVPAVPHGGDSTVNTWHFPERA